MTMFMDDFLPEQPQADMPRTETKASDVIDFRVIAVSPKRNMWIIKIAGYMIPQEGKIKVKARNVVNRIDSTLLPSRAGTIHQGMKS